MKQGQAWLRQAWSSLPLAEAVTVASPALARQVCRACVGECSDPRELRRIVLSLARYVLRARGRATPFGLFAGVAAARLGPQASARWGRDHRPVARPGAQWVAAVVADLEACPELLRRLPVVMNDLAIVIGDRLVLPFEQDDSADSGRGSDPAVAEVSVRYTKAVDAVIRHARSPIVAGELTVRVAAEFPRTQRVVIEGMIADLARLGLLVTALQPPMTITDPLSHVVARMAEVGIPELAGRVTELRAISHGFVRHNRAGPSANRQVQRARLAERMRRVADPAGWAIYVDLRLDADLVLPEAVAREAAAAASALARLTPYPAGLPALAEYHAAFMERYGLGAIVPVLEAVSPGTGLGFPATYRGSARQLPAPPLSDRDRRLTALAQGAVMADRDEVVLDDRAISALETPGEDRRQIPPHAEITVEIQAAGLAEIDRGEYTLVVTGASRAAGTTAGRFLDLLQPEELGRFRAAYSALAASRDGALPIQLSCPPLHARSQTAARAPLMLPDLISVAEHRDASSQVIPLADLAVGCDAHGMYLVSLSRGRLVEPTVLNSVEFRHFSHPISRFLCEITQARSAVYMPFSWGAADSLPFLPRLRYRRSVLATARWILPASDLPGKSAPYQDWKVGLASWRSQFRLPASVYLAEADNLLPLDLDENLCLLILRSHLDRHPQAMIREAPAPGARGWADGRATQIVVPLTDATARAASPTPASAGPIWVAGRGDGHLPGHSGWLYAKLYGDPERHGDLMDRLPALLSAWDDPPEWWYLPYRDTEPHLRLRFRLNSPGAYGQAACRIGEWAAEMRNVGLLGRVQFDTYFPETGRYGHGAAMTAAESVFAADSAVAVAQARLAGQARIELDAITVVGLVDIAASFVGGTDAGMRWLADHLPREPVTVDRALREITVRLASPRDDWAALRATPGASEVREQWARRRRAMAAYRHKLAAQRDPLLVLPSLLHLHHVRMLGLDPERERLGRHLARATALAWTATLRSRHDT